MNERQGKSDKGGRKNVQLKEKRRRGELKKKGKQELKGGEENGEHIRGTKGEN